MKRLFLLLILLLPLVSSASISFISPTPTNGATISNKTMDFYVNLSNNDSLRDLSLTVKKSC